MTARRSRGPLLALLFVLSVGAVAVLVLAMDDDPPPPVPPDLAAAAPPPPPAPAPPPRPAVVDVPPAVAPDPGPPAPVEKPAAPPPVAEPSEEKSAAAGDPNALAVLTLELLQPGDPEERRITARVLDTFGAPLPDVLVVFREGSALLYRERTDEAGYAYFVPYDFEHGPFRVDALAEGYATRQAPSVAAGARVELVLAARPEIQGVVRAPAEGRGRVKLFTANDVFETDIAADGSFRFADLDEGIVTVQADVPPYGGDEVTLEIEAGFLHRVVLRIRPRERVPIYGEVRNWPGKGQLWINGVSVPVRATGNYEFKHAVFGVNEVLVEAPEKALLLERFVVKTHARTKYDFRLRGEATLKGRVRSDRGLPVVDAEVRLGIDFADPENDRVPLFPIGRVPVVRTDHVGNFEIPRLDRRLTYLVSVVAHGHGQALVRVLPSLGRHRIELPAGPFVYGRLRGLGGVPKDAVVTARRLADYEDARRFNVPLWDGAKSGRDHRGFYGLSGLVPGLYAVRVDAPDYGSVETVLDLREPVRARVDLRVRRGSHLEDADAELLRRLPPVLRTGTEAEAEPAPGGETIVHIDAQRPAHEEPLPGVRVRFFEGDAEISAPMEFVESAFDLVGLPEGNYRAILTHPTFPKPLVVEGIELRRNVPYTIELR